MKGLRSRVRVEIVKGEEVVVDEELASILYLIEKEGSLLKASRILGIPYSRTWEKVSKAERILGRKIIVARRGGKGGAKLTDEGLELLSMYMKEFRRLTGMDFYVMRTKEGKGRLEEILITGSNDILLELLLGELRSNGILVESHWIGSLNGLASIILGEGDVAGIHLFDEEKEVYNITYFKKLGLEGIARLLRGYRRELGFVIRKRSSLDEILNGLLTGELTLVNRQKGSGTRRILDWLLKRYARKMKISIKEIPSRVRGYSNEVNTHLDVGRAVAGGEADVGLAIKHVSRLYSLNFVHVTWEHFDFVVNTKSLEKRGVRTFIEILRGKTRELAEKLDGYEIGKDLGEFIA